MTLTVRSANITGATTKGSKLTYEELDANWAHVIESSNHNFTPSGTQSSRTVASKLQDVVSAKDEGAKGDGSTDDDTAFSEVEDRSEDFIYLPEGNYITDGEMTKKYYGPGKINGKKLYNFDRIQPIPHAARLWHKIRQNADDLYILVLGDSTGNATDEWVYLWATQLGIDAPTHSIKYRLFTDGSGWGSESTIDSGSGSKSIYFDNVSVPSSSSLYSTGDHSADIYSLSRTYDYVILNYGHNDGTSTSAAALRSIYTSVIMEVRAVNQTAVVCATLQNPRTDQLAHSAKVVGVWREVAELHGLGLINVYDVFTALGNPSGLYTDATHPNAAGMRVWTSVVNQAMGESMTHQAYQIPQSCVLVQKVNYAPNPAFNEWGSSAPDGWTATNCTATQDNEKTETFMFSVSLETTNASAPKLEANLSSYLASLRGKWITAAARTYRTDSESTTGGRIQIQGTETSAVSSAIVNGDGWSWHVAQAFVESDETSLAVRVLAGTTVGNIVWVDRICVVEGLIPGDVDIVAQPNPEASEFYVSGNVGVPAGNSGTLTADATGFSITGTQAGSRVYVNVPQLIPGHQYTVTWTRGDSNTGTVFIRQGANGVGTVTTSDTLQGDGSITWTSVLANETILFASDSSFTSMDIDSISITKVDMPAITQATSKSTSVTMNTEFGEITMNGAELAAATVVSFTFTNSTLTAEDVLTLNHVSGGTIGAYTLNAVCADGSATIYVRNATGGALSEAVVIRYRKDE